MNEANISELNQSKKWFLGLYFDDNYFAAALLDRQANQQYPIFWQKSDQSPTYLLPTVAYCDANSQFILGIDAVKQAKNNQGIYLEKFQAYLNLTIPYYEPEKRQWQPHLQGDLDFSVTLYWIRQAVKAFCLTLTPINATIKGDLTIGTTDLSSTELAAALSQLEAVIVNLPTGWNESYRFNLREAILGAKLVQKPDQIFFVEEAIASFLGYLSSLSQTQLQPETTLLINLGALTTELALINWQDPCQNFHQDHFQIKSWAYGINHLPQDILSQLIYPQWSPYLDYNLSKLELDSLKPGIAQTAKRNALNLHLQSSPLGRSLTQAANLVELVLQKKTAFTSNLGKWQWGVKRQHFQDRVIAPIVSQFNQQINQLLSQTNLSDYDIAQVVFTGNYDPTLIPVFSELLNRKLANINLIKLASLEDTKRIVLGLSLVPLFPQVINSFNHQYSDYFLLLELLKTIDKTTFTLTELCQSLEKRGLNTRLCGDQIRQLLTGKLPLGLLPSLNDFRVFTQASQNNPDYQILNTDLWITKQQDQSYQINQKQLKILGKYFKLILASSQQKMKDPLIFFN
jgi:hypothetical protein